MTNAVRAHYCGSGRDKQLPVTWDADAECYVTTEQCDDCQTMFELFEGEP